MSVDDVAIERATDIEASWSDLTRLFEGIVAYHEPLTGERLQSGWEEAWRALIMREDTIVLLARDVSGRAIGLAVAAERRNPVLGVDAGFIDTVCVEAAWRRRGLARRFVESIEQWCRERGLDRLDLSVRSANSEAVAAWRAMGFEDESLRLKKRLD